jgi:hypothetical protein
VWEGLIIPDRERNEQQLYNVEYTPVSHSLLPVSASPGGLAATAISVVSRCGRIFSST